MLTGNAKRWQAADRASDRKESQPHCADRRQDAMRFTTSTAAWLVVIVLLSVPTAAQTRTDFSGVWKPQPPSPTSRRISLTIVQSTTEVRIERRFERAGQEIVETVVTRFDGTESVNEKGTKTKATWEGAALIVTSLVPMEGQDPWQVTDVYRIEKGVLVVENTMKNFRGTFSGKRMYSKE